MHDPDVQVKLAFFLFTQILFVHLALAEARLAFPVLERSDKDGSRQIWAPGRELR